jgi:hypothetical protein
LLAADSQSLVHRQRREPDVISVKHSNHEENEDERDDPLLTLRIVLPSIAVGATAGLAIMIASGYHHRQRHEGQPTSSATDRHSVAPKQLNGRQRPAIPTCDSYLKYGYNDCREDVRYALVVLFCIGARLTPHRCGPCQRLEFWGLIA